VVKTSAMTEDIMIRINNDLTANAEKQKNKNNKTKKV